jgi:hypothetical protein
MDGPLAAVGLFYLSVVPVWLAGLLSVVLTLFTLVKPTRTGRTLAVVCAAVSAVGGIVILVFVGNSALLSTYGTIPLFVGLLSGAGAWVRTPPTRSAPPRSPLDDGLHDHARARRLLGGWVLAHAGADGATALAFMALQSTLTPYLTPQASHGGLQIVPAIILALLAIPTGTAEWLVLRQFRVSPWWIVVSSVPVLAVSLFTAASTRWIVSATALGLCVGLAQWLVFRGRMPRSAVWLAAVPTAHLVSSAVVQAVVGAVSVGNGMSALLAIPSALAYAAVTGAALAYMTLPSTS